MDRLVDWVQRVARWGGLFGGALLLLAALVVSVDVVLRKWFLVTLGGADELAGYALAISSSWGLAYALVNRVHIRIDSLYVLLPVRVCAVLDILAVTAFAAFFGVVAWHAYFVFEQSVVSGSRSLSPLGTPVMIPQALWVAGLAEFVLAAAVLFARGLMLLVSGDAAAVQRLLGSRSAIEEVEDEVRAVRAVGELAPMETAR
jgi:TRAP-type C4-dicarboxylate transport system permease small subunit